MSISQDEIKQISEFNTPTRSVFGNKKNKRRNKVHSPPEQSPCSKSGKKSDVFELFTIKTPQQKNPSDSQDTSDLSDDVFVKLKPPLSTPSTKSYREKINERFKNVKEKAGKSTKKANVFKEATEKILLDKVKRESSDIDAELEEMRNRLKLGKISGNNEIYDFFCAEKCQESLSQGEEEKFKSTDHLTDGQDVIFTLPQTISSSLTTSEQASLFKPKAKPVDIIDKIDDAEPRFLEDEGFYVPPKPNIPTQHLHLLEQRLSQDDKKWFDCEGNLAVVENPIQKTSYRPQMKHLPVKEIATYLQPTIEDCDCDEIVIVRDNILQLQISTLKFTHHPLFSLEHVLEQKLRKLYQEHEECVLRNNLSRLTRRLEGLRHILRRMEENSSQSGDHSDREDEKINAYRRDIKTLQKQVFEEGRTERDRIKLILATWKAIKNIREANKYSNTSIKLIIRKEKVDYESEKDNFDRNFEELYEETLSDYQQKTKRRRNEEEIREDLLERFKESFRMPGEPILHFILSNDHAITSNIENPKESTRRNIVSSTKITLKIVCNKMEVCKTKYMNLSHDFTCNFDENISLQLINVPKYLTIEIIEQPKSLIKRTLGELSVTLPERNRKKNNEQIVNFEKNEVVHYKHEGVGSGIKLNALMEDLELEEDQEMNTAGSLTYSVQWDNPVNSEEQDSDEDGTKIINQIIDKSGSIDVEKLSQWMHQHKPDPQDPRNSVLFEYSLDCSDQDASTSTNKKNYFRLNPHMDRWKFCEPRVLEDNLRLKILQLRNENEPEFDRMVIPNRIKEIPLDILADYKRRIASEGETFSIEDDDVDEDEIVKKRSRGRKYLKQIHIRVFQKCKNSENNLTFEDVVDEKFLPHFEKLIKDMMDSFLAWFRWRPLKPSLSDTKEPPQESKLNDYELKSQARVVITVISALNIPERFDNQSEVTPFVEADYNNATARTSRSKGPHPSWNEKIALPLEPSHLDYLNPHSLNGTIALSIFDEDDKDLLKFPGMKRRNWLGCLEIPLSAICSGGIQGMFKMKTPHLLLGYKGKDQSAKMNHMYINLHLTVEPNIPKLTPTIEELPCADLPYIKEHAMRWNEDYNLNFPNRKFSVFAIDANATTTCIVRYIKPLEPPQVNVEGFDVTPEQCARFISLIPFTDCNQFYKNIWLSVDRFLHFMIGSVIDHAVALTCYLLALKLDVWLLLGFGVPYGSTAFVLVKEHNSQIPVYSIYDVVHGEKINLTDPFCPLHRVYCVINEHNVWANIQRSDDVTVMRFDFTQKSDWLPLFNNQITAPTNSVHGRLSYLPIPAVEELEIIVDRKIRKKISKMRQLDRTIWNHQVSNAFKSALCSYEKTEMYQKNSSDAVERIREYMATYKIRGHVFNSPFIDVGTIVKKAKSYGLHLEEDEDIQFASAVFVKAYPNQVLAVWVFLATIKEHSVDLKTIN